MSTVPGREALAELYLHQLPYPPYPVQEEALLAWFRSGFITVKFTGFLAAIFRCLTVMKPLLTAEQVKLRFG
jgi:hypothetical protein